MSRSLLVAAFLATIALLAAPVSAQVSRAARQPVRTDTLIARYGATVIGRGITVRTYRSNEIQQTYVWQSAADGSRVTDSLWLDAGSLQPRREVRIASDTTIRVVYGKGQLEVRAVARGKELYRRTVKAPAVYHSSASLEALAASMPLQSGASATFTTYYAPPSRHGFQATNVRVVAEEQVGGKSTWRIRAETPSGSTTFWVSSSAREVLQFDVQEGAASITFRR